MVIIPGRNMDEIEAMRKFCAEKKLDLQLIRQFSLSEQKSSVQGYDRPPKCQECNKIRLLADGMIKPCLFTDVEIKVDMNDIKSSLAKAIGLKPERGSVCETRAMNQI